MAGEAAQLLFPAAAQLAEGPLWHEGALWWVNINAGTLNRLDVDACTNESRQTCESLGAAVPACEGGWLLAGGHWISHYEWETQRLSRLGALTTSHPLIRFNDAKCDPRGRFFAGTIHKGLETGGAAFYRYNNGSLHLQFDGVTISNGFDWSPGGERMFYADTATGRIDVFDYDLTFGRATNRRPFVEIPVDRGGPDGLCVDIDGNVWVALWGGGCVECFHGSTGKSLRRVAVPVSKVSSCCFGGESFDTLFITTAWEGHTESQRNAEPLAGGIFWFRPGVRGRPPTCAIISSTPNQ